MIISEITTQYEFPDEIKTTSLNVVLDLNGDDGVIQTKGSFVKRIDDNFKPFKLANGLENFDIFSGTYTELIRRCLESKKLTDLEITSLIKEVQELRQKIEFVCELSLNLGYKAEIFKIPSLPTNKK